ncbi:MCC family protein [Megaselia abdita]
MEEAIEDKEQTFRRLEMMSNSHESRITEMHCVIAELSKKLRNKQDNVIMEETEVEGSEISYQEGSVFESEVNLTNPDVECQTEGLDEETNHDTLPMHDNIKIVNDNIVKSQMDALQEEVLHLRAEIALLQSQIAINPYCSSPLEVKDEFIKNPEYDNEDMNNFDSNERNEFYKTDCQDAVNEKCIPKIAEKVKLKRNIKTNTPEIIDYEINKAELMIKDFALDEAIVDSTIQRLQNRIEQYKMKNSVLTLTLRECKEHCDHLYLLCGKYESNALALQSALNCSDRAIEAYDVMLALLESKLALLKDCSLSSKDSRKAVEAVAQHLLDRLESEKDQCENSLGPWQNTFSINSMDDKPWTIDNDNRLRNHVSKLKGRRSALQNTLVVLESPFSQIHDRVQTAFDSKENLMEQTNLPVSEVLDNLNEALNKQYKKNSDSLDDSDDQGLLNTS